MSDNVEISGREARRLAVISQGLNKSAPFGRGKEAVLRAIRHLGYVQIDTISVLERAHNHTLRSRVPNYAHRYLHDLQVRDRKVLEYWAHAAAFLPMEDYRFGIPVMEYFKSHSDPWPKASKQIKRDVLDRIRRDGPLRSKDFAPLEDRAGEGWWDWKPTKLALQRLFFEGELVVSHREGFQRVYDLPERVIPTHIPVSSPSEDEYADYLIDGYINAHGFGDPGMISYLRKGIRRHVERRLAERVNRGELIMLQICGLDGRRFYTTQACLDRLGQRISKTARLISPFDNLVIQRQRLSEIFGFEYQIECYVPRPKRVYGYYVLPVLYGDRFVGRIDARAKRREGVLVIEQLHCEATTSLDKLLAILSGTFAALAIANGCQTIVPGERLHVTARYFLHNELSKVLPFVKS